MSGEADRIFISYRRSDAGGYAGNLVRELRRRFGDQVYQDVERSHPGDRYKETIDRAIARSYVVVVVIGPDWLSVRDGHGKRRLDDPDDLLRREVTTALSRDDVTVMPVLVGGARRPESAELPPDLSPLLDRTDYRLDEGERRASDLGWLVRVIDERIEVRSAARATIAALLAAALLLWPARLASTAVWEAWERPDQRAGAEALVRLGVLHAVSWAMLAAAAAAAAAFVARGRRSAGKAAITGGLAGAAGGLLGGVIDQALRAQEQPDLGLLVGFTITAMVAAVGGLAGRTSTRAIVAAGVGALMGGLVSLLGHELFWDYALPVLGAVAGAGVARLSAAGWSPHFARRRGMHGSVEPRSMVR